MNETGYLPDNSQYIIRQNENGMYSATRFFGDCCTDDIIIEDVTYKDAAAAVDRLALAIAESIIG